MHPIWIIRLSFKRLLVKLGYGLRMIEFCERCGRRQTVVWRASNALWGLYSGCYRVLCLDCFDDLATRRGRALRWFCEVDQAARRTHNEHT